MSSAGDRASASLGVGLGWADPAWYDDGVPDLFLGLAALVAALFFLAWAGFTIALFFGFYAAFWGVGFLGRSAITTAKAGLRGDEPGAVRRRLRGLSRWDAVALGVCLAALAFLALSRLGGFGRPDLPLVPGEPLRRWWPALLGAAILLGLLAPGFRRRRRQRLLAGGLALGGILVGWRLGLGQRDALALAAAAQGAVLALGSARSLCAVRRDRRPPSPGQGSPRPAPGSSAARLVSAKGASRMVTARAASGTPGRRPADREWFADGLPDLIYGLAWLVSALFFFAWAEFGIAFFLAFLALHPAGGLFRGMLATAKLRLSNPEASGPRWWLPQLSRWRAILLGATVLVLTALAVVRLSRLGEADRLAADASALERWWPIVLTAPIPLAFVASWRRLGLPRHLAIGLAGLAGAVAGPLLGLAWRDALALAAATLGSALIVSGGLTLRAYLRSRPPAPAA